VQGELSFETGDVTKNICERARWTDLVVVSMLHPPGAPPRLGAGEGLGPLLRHCGRPVLAAPEVRSPLDKALLAYDGSPKSNEALFVAAYLASRWQISLVVMTAQEKGLINSDTLDRAQKYLEARQVEATFVEKQEPVGQAIEETATDRGCNFIIMGGYGFGPMLEVVFGSTVDQILQAKRWPVLICQ
jgi:nucleotide-binding universal stress UspA family protein